MMVITKKTPIYSPTLFHNNNCENAILRWFVSILGDLENSQTGRDDTYHWQNRNRLVPTDCHLIQSWNGTTGSTLVRGHKPEQSSMNTSIPFFKHLATIPIDFTSYAWNVCSNKSHKRSSVIPNLTFYVLQYHLNNHRQLNLKRPFELSCQT